MNNWWSKGILFFIVGIGGILSLHYTSSHFKADRQLILLNRTRPDFHHLIEIENFPSAAISKGDLKEYFDYFHLVTEAMPENADGKLLLGYLYQITGDQTQAGTFLKEAYRLDQKFFFIQYDLALYYFNQGEYTHSSELLKNALSSAPSLTFSRMMNSIIYRQILSSINDSKGMIGDFQQAYQDAYTLLIESNQKESQGANRVAEVHAHIL